MNYLNPIFTEKRECQDCYKCVRNCPVKAIKVEGGYASVIAELCIVCGQCVEVCPNGAKRVRDDLPHARQLLKTREQVFVSLAPSYVSDFPNVRPGQMVQALKRLGFAGVSETALGAQQVSAQAAALLQEAAMDAGGAGRRQILLSSACPTVVCYVQKHRPADSPNITEMLSPLLTHCAMLRKHYGPEIGIVFIGPCIAKKLEATAHPELLDAALTFEDLRRWFEAEKLDPTRFEAGVEDGFVPEGADEGTWYPVDGGMIAGMKAVCAVNDCSLMAFSGLTAIEKAITGLGDSRLDGPLFLELLACEGGCVNGPKAGKRDGTAAKRCRVLRQGRRSDASLPRTPGLALKKTFAVPVEMAPKPPEAQVREALKLVGKFSHEDELDCGGCGYNSCREFAVALIGQKAERSMCVTYMRKLALKKANALIQKMPSAVVIVNDAMRIIECNTAFAKMFGRKSDGPDTALLEGVMLSEVMPFASLFHNVLKTGDEIVDRDLRYQNTILHTSIFTIEKHCVIGAILQDITEPAVRKQQVIRKAQEVIQRSLTTTQEIARLLGESAAETEITLNSIIDSFTPEKPEEPKVENDWRKLYRR
jgi:iron only hydrogenase large subunit-like protein